MSVVSFFLRRVVPTIIGAFLGALVGWWVGTGIALVVFAAAGAGIGFAAERVRHFAERHHRTFTIHYAAVICIGLLVGGAVGWWLEAGRESVAFGAMIGAAFGLACVRTHYWMRSGYIDSFWNRDVKPSPEKRAAVIACVREREKREGAPYGNHATILHEIAETDDAEDVNQYFGRFMGHYAGRLAPKRFWFNSALLSRAGDFARPVDNIEARDSLGASPMHYAARSDAANSIEALALHGADIEARTKESATPLHLAAFNGAGNAISALIKHGADINALTDMRETPLDLAVKGNHGHILSLLLAHGAKSGGGEDLDSLFSESEDPMEALDIMREK